jgi:hypothetical protein
MFYEDGGRPWLAVEVETDNPPKGHALELLGRASIWIQIVTLAADIDFYDERARPNPIYGDAALAARPAPLADRVNRPLLNAFCRLLEHSTRGACRERTGAYNRAPESDSRYA